MSINKIFWLAATFSLMSIALGTAGDARGSSATANRQCTVSSVTSYEQAGGITAGGLYMLPPPSPKIASDLIGDWEGENSCSTGPEKLKWQISQGEDGQIQVQEEYRSNRMFKRTGHVLYNARWSNPLLVLVSMSISKYRIALKRAGVGTLEGRYFNHINCMTLTLHKIT